MKNTVFSLIVSTSLAYSFNCTAQTETFLAEARGYMTELAEELLPLHDTLAIVTSDNKNFSIVTNKAIYEEGAFDGFELLTAHRGKKSFFIKEVVESKYKINFSRNIFHLPENGDEPQEIKIPSYSYTALYMAIVAKGKIIYEYEVPRHYYPGNEMTEIDAACIFLDICVAKTNRD
ncbi:MAG: hypothetical protein J5554_08595 [Paludibacteraceae bacterium]|nr:hypothetical protein [Paludibacteraceae bacterium]